MKFKHKMYIPNDIYAMICHFCWGFNMKTSIFGDIEFVIDVKKHIPAIFFREKIPLRTLFDDAPSEPMFSMFCEKNPFIEGHAFIPTETVFKSSIVNLDLVHFAIDMLKKETFYKYGTRSYFAHRTACSLAEYIFTGSWRYLQYTKLFFMLSESDNYCPKNNFERCLVECIVTQISNKMPSTQLIDLS